MRRIHQSILIICIIVILSTPSHAKKSKTCPLGFNLAESHYKDIDHVCYKRKDLESFAETLKECDGNLYTSKLYRNLNIAQLDYSDYLWSEYKTFYPGGPYVSWSIAEHEWSIQEDVYNYNPPLQYDLDQNLCLVFNKHGNYSTVNCDEQFYRYCLVEPYPERKDMSRKGCEDLRGSWRVGNSKEMCLFDVRGVGGGTVRATWNQSRSLCAKHGGSLLSKGWQHASMGAFQTSGISPIYPLGIIWDHESRSLQYVSESEDISVEEPFETFGSSLNATIETMYMAIQDETWFPVNNTYLFFDVICERPVRPRQISLQLTINADNKMILEVNGEVDKDDIHCTTDSESYKPTKVKIHHDDDKDIYILSPATDGSYWCTHVDRYNYKETNSGVVLFTRERASLVNLYAVKIRVNNWFKFDEADDLKDGWKEKLEEYIFYRTKYVQMYDYKDLNPINVENILRSFQKTMIGLNWRSGDAIYKIRVKRLYMDRLTVLLHVELNPEMIPVTPGTWGDLEVLFMKPAYYCKGFDSIPRQSIGESTYAPNCRTFTCVGDFNEGVQWVETGTPGCIATTSVPMEKSISIKDDVTYRMPTIPPTTILTREQSSISLETEDVDHQDLKNDDSLLAPVNSTAGYNVTERMTDDSDDSDESGESTTIITTANYPITENYVPTHIRPPTLPTTTTIEPVLTSTLPTTLAPDLQLEQVLHDLEELLEDTTAEITIDRVDPAFDLVNEIFGGAGNNLEIPSDLLHMLDELGSRMYLNGSTRAATIRTNVALLVADAAPENPIRGVRVAVENQTGDTFTENSFEFIDELNSTQLAANQSAAVVYLPESLTTSEHRVSFVIFRNERAFRPQEGVQVNSHVISVNVENTTTFESGDVIDIHLAPVVEDPDGNTTRACAYWHFLNGTGYWSQEGCTFIKSTIPGTLDTCRCDHLTHFAEILVQRTAFSEKNENALEILSIIGCCLSLLGLALIVVTATLFRTWRREFSNKIWLQLCIAIFILVISFLVIVFARFDGYNVPCMLIGITLHYSVLASFCWMLVAAIISYRRLVLVFTRDISHKLLRASAFSWGAPFAIVGVLLSIDPHSYSGQFEEMNAGSSFCYPSGLGLWLAVYAPIAAMLVANWTLFLLIVRSVFASRRIQRHGDTNEALRCACVSCLLVFLFGLPWVFGLFAYNVVAAYFFTCTATFQGFVLFIFIVLGNKKTRDLWLNKLKIKRIKKVPVTTSTYTNRSVGGGTRPERSVTTMEAKDLKPRSLSSQDDSRFS